MKNLACRNFTVVATIAAGLVLSAFSATTAYAKDKPVVKCFKNEMRTATRRAQIQNHRSTLDRVFKLKTNESLTTCEKKYKAKIPPQIKRTIISKAKKDALVFRQKALKKGQKGSWTGLNIRCHLRALYDGGCIHTPTRP